MSGTGSILSSLATQPAPTFVVSGKVVSPQSAAVGGLLPTSRDDAADKGETTSGTDHRENGRGAT